jgi:hypothetical protein
MPQGPPQHQQQQQQHGHQHQQHGKQHLRRQRGCCWPLALLPLLLLLLLRLLQASVMLQAHLWLQA